MKLYLTQTYSGSDWTNEWHTTKGAAIEMARTWEEMKVPVKIFGVEIEGGKDAFAEAMNCAGYNHMNLTEVDCFVAVEKIR